MLRAMRTRTLVLLATASCTPAHTPAPAPAPAPAPTPTPTPAPAPASASSSASTPAPTSPVSTLARAPGNCGTVALDDTYAYWIGSDGVHRVPKRGGGPAVTLVPAPSTRA